MESTHNFQFHVKGIEVLPSGQNRRKKQSVGVYF